MKLFKSLQNKEKLGYNLIVVWITVLMLTYFAVIEPLNRIQLVIRKTGVISISPGSIMANKDIVLPVIISELGKWIGVVALWVICFILVVWVNKKKANVFGRITSVFSDKKTLDMLFYIGVFIEMIWAAFFYGSYNIPFAAFWVYVAMVCFTTRIVANAYKYSGKVWNWICLLILMGIICELFTGRAFVLRALLLIIASDEIDWKFVVKWYFVVNVAAFVIIVFCSYVGISGDWIEIDAFRSESEVANRYLLGYNSANTTSYMVVKLILVAIYLWWDKLKLWHIVTMLFIVGFIYYLTDSRTSMLAGLSAIIMVVFYKYFKTLRDWKIWSILSIALIFFLASFSLHFLQWDFYEYDTLHSCPNYVYVVGQKMVGRIHQAIKFTQGIVPLPFGTYKPGVYVDMGYIKFFMQEGFVVFVLYFYAVFKTLLWQQKNKEYPFIIIIVALSLRMLMESSFVPFVFQNVILLLFIGRWREIL